MFLKLTLWGYGLQSPLKVLYYFQLVSRGAVLIRFILIGQIFSTSLWMYANADSLGIWVANIFCGNSGLETQQKLRDMTK